MKYTITDFRGDFPDDDACLEWLKNYLYPDGIFCPNDKKITPHHKLRQRKAYSCELCGHHTYPTANTIFHKSSTPLTLWFYAIYLMASTRAGISAKQLERELGVTYKTAWRMFHQIRKMTAISLLTVKSKLTKPTSELKPAAVRQSSLSHSNQCSVSFNVAAELRRLRLIRSESTLYLS
jgi:transposase